MSDITHTQRPIDDSITVGGVKEVFPTPKEGMSYTSIATMTDEQIAAQAAMAGDPLHLQEIALAKAGAMNMSGVSEVRGTISVGDRVYSKTKHAEGKVVKFFPDGKLHVRLDNKVEIKAKADNLVKL